MRDALLRAGATHFSKNGYAGANIRAILDDAGATAPALYHHFGNKTGLYVATASEAENHVLNVFRSAIADQRSLTDRVSALLAATVTLRREHPHVAEYLLVVHQDVARHPELRELASYDAEFDEFWQSVADKTAKKGIAAAVRVIIEGLMVTGGATAPIEEVAASAHALDLIIRKGI